MDDISLVFSLWEDFIDFISLIDRTDLFSMSSISVTYDFYLIKTNPQCIGLLLFSYLPSLFNICRICSDDLIFILNIGNLFFLLLFSFCENFILPLAFKYFL